MKILIPKSIIVGLLATLAGLTPESAAIPSTSGAQAATGILLLAHGGSKKKWNKDVSALAAQVRKTMPTQVAFGMADKKTMQAAIDRLSQQGAREIIAVPLFISSHSSLIESEQYLLGLRAKAPPDLAMFARMYRDAAGRTDPGSPAMNLTTPVKCPVPIQMASAIDHSPLVAQILLSHAERLSKNPARETVILVAHGPVSDGENKKWLADMGILADTMRRNSQFKRIETLTLRDDAPQPIRSRATAQLRSVVEQANRQGNRVLIVPLLISYGGIEKGIKKRLAGLKYVMSRQGLLPDRRMAEWVLQQAQGNPNSTPQLEPKQFSVQ
ncbi:MAG TPA: CbiX/SirB N-terminal domain-containing protein [Terriglobia bacterium]|nr:CbiX/SirB N-terminal domain-containing protein [Terriglobia bacterium]